MPLAAVGFDLDDTLCVPERDRAALLDAAVAEADAPPASQWASRAAYRQAHREHLTDETRTPVFETMVDRMGVDADPVRLAQAYRQQVNQAIRPVDGVETLLADLRADYRVGLLTNGPRQAQYSKLETLDWVDVFDAVCVSGELPAGKPDGRAFGALVDRLGVEPSELVYVGDDVEADVAGAQAAGCLTVQVVHGPEIEPDPRANTHVQVETLAEDLPVVLATLA